MASTNTNRPDDGGIEAVLDEWTARVVSVLGLAPDSVDAALVLDLTRDVAHGVARPAAPLTAFLVGLAAGRAGGDSSAVRAAVDTVLALLPSGDGAGDGEP
ncbi:DUF6457 domain-containing protein [Parafrankia sp. EUN1f]|uniref:DUF6457 domain-containing protein n=1 Tax=Parafrankia sp. EUN1f TaxID=102897 RepID=UPI0001C44760|nr:DUF6457 domain-containing protein [Parafrankia sp. EUN1f]EFC82460.1 hypothetical protein FrEUN1fDRAFT_4394 [Parafrankia sp. EUN1f]